MEIESKTDFGFFKLAKYFVYAYFFSIIIIGVITGVGYGLETHDWKPLLRNTGGLVLASDDSLYYTVREYATLQTINSTLVNSMDARASANYQSFLRESALKYLFILGIMVYLSCALFSKLMKWITGFSLPLLAFIFGVLFLAVLEVAWVGLVEHDLVVPFRGVGLFITHFFDFFKFSGVIDSASIVSG